MRVIVLVKASQYCEEGVPPSAELISAINKYNQELIAAGVMLAGDRLEPSSKGARLRFEGQKRIVVDGPFPETKELVGGYWVWRVKSLQEAIDWLKRAPFDRDVDFEIRPMMEPENFGCEITPALNKDEERLREPVAARVS